METVENSKDPGAVSRPAQFVSSSQRQALPKLEELYRAGLMGKTFGKILPRTKPLLVGPSGCGKTACVRMLAQKLGMEILSVNAGAWVCCGALDKNRTLPFIHNFVHQQWGRGGIVLVDEIDKCVPHGNHHQDSWTQGVFAELLALLDADPRLVLAGWSEEAVEVFSSGLFMVAGAGAWQHLSKGAERPLVGFGSHKTPGYLQRLADDFGIPDEVAFRFCPDLVFIEPPTEQDFYEGIKLIHSDSGIAVPGEEECRRLASEAAGRKIGVRWLENYALGLLKSNLPAEIQRPSIPERPDAEVGCRSKSTSFARDEINAGLRRWNERLVKVHEAALKLQALLPPEPTEEALKDNEELRDRAAFYTQVGDVAGHVKVWFLRYSSRTSAREGAMREKIGDFMQTYVNRHIPGFSQEEGGPAIKQAVFDLYILCFASEVAAQMALYPTPESPDEKNNSSP